MYVIPFLSMYRFEVRYIFRADTSEPSVFFSFVCTHHIVGVARLCILSRFRASHNYVRRSRRYTNGVHGDGLWEMDGNDCCALLYYWALGGMYCGFKLCARGSSVVARVLVLRWWWVYYRSDSIISSSTATTTVS